MKPLYELVILNSTKKLAVRQTTLASCEKSFVTQLDKQDVVQLNTYRYISFQKNFLYELKSKIENTYKKEKFTNIIRNFFATKHIEFIEEESESESRYFKFQIPEFDKIITIRLSDHQPYKVCASLAIRYDKYSFTASNLTYKIEGMINKLIARKALENSKKEWRSKENSKCNTTTYK